MKKGGFLSSINAALVKKGLVGYGVVSKDGVVAIREGMIASWMPEPGRSVVECPLLSSVRDDLRSMTPDSEPLIIPDFTVVGFSHLGKLTVTITNVGEPEHSVVVLTTLARRDNTTQQIARTKVREQDMLEERMLAATREIERMNRQLEQFASVAAHDLQAPVRQISTLVGFLRGEMGVELSAAGDILLENIEEVLRRMRSQIDGLYEYSRTSSQPLERESFALAVAVEGALSNLSAQIIERGAHISMGDLPSVNASKGLMVSVFQNLIGNALKYCKDHAPEVEIAAHDLVDRMVITVTDNGPGIEPAYSETIFKLFSRGYPRVSADGIGIGLALCRQIVARHHGTIRHDASFDAGTRMVIELPKPKEGRG